VKRNRWQENPNGLEPLAAQATDYALHMMRTTGSVPPTVMLPIFRKADGAFTDFGDPGPMHFGESVGRFSGLMLRNKTSVSEAASAKAALLALGMNIVNRGFDPTMN
jgi:hypothetical protein